MIKPNHFFQQAADALVAGSSSRAQVPKIKPKGKNRS
jgi:hypothetical protein